MAFALTSLFCCFLLILAIAQWLAGQPQGPHRERAALELAKLSAQIPGPHGPQVPMRARTNVDNYAKIKEGGKLFDKIMVGQYDAEYILKKQKDFLYDTLYTSFPAPEIDVINLIVSTNLASRDLPGLTGSRMYPNLRRALIYIDGEYVRIINKTYSGNADKMARDIEGLLVHLLARVLQHQPKDALPPPGWLTGMADFVREKSKLIPDNWNHKPEASRNWDDGYQFTCYFLKYVEAYVSNFVEEMNNLIGKFGYDPFLFVLLTGRRAEQLWASYTQHEL